MAFGGITGKQTTTYTNEEIDGMIQGVPKIEIGSYTGTGTYGVDNPNSLTFSFLPKIVLLCVSSNNPEAGFITSSFNAIPWGVQRQIGLTSSFTNPNANTFSFSGTTMSWYNDRIANSQLNNADTVYYYIALG